MVNGAKILLIVLSDARRERRESEAKHLVSVLRNWASVVDDPVTPGPPELQLAPNRISEKGIAAAPPRRLARARVYGQREWSTGYAVRFSIGGVVSVDPVARAAPAAGAGRSARRAGGSVCRAELAMAARPSRARMDEQSGERPQA